MWNTALTALRRAPGALRVLLALLVLPALPALPGSVPAVAAQSNTGELVGIVRDESGGVLPGAEVVATHLGTGLSIYRVTTADGRFFMASLPIGDWEVAAELPGFRRIVQTGIVVEMGRALDLEFRLDLGQITEEVTVTANTPLLQTTTAEISDVIENREVEQIPLNGRQFLQLAQLSDAVVIPPGGTRGAALQQAGPLPNVGGQRAGHNIYLLDGVKVTDELFNNLVINPSVDSIQEFKIQKSMYPPEFGGKASALINVATKSGSNRMHGSAFTFVRDERFDAHNYFDPRNEPVPPLDQGQFGGTFGGAIARDRTFVFLSYEGQRTTRSLTRTFSVPSAPVRAGDFAGHDPLCDPLSRDPVTGACGSYFAGNRIPADRIDPLARAFLERVPPPNSGAGEVQNLTSVEPSESDVDQFSVRVDQRIGTSDQAFVRFSTFDARDLQPFGTSVQQETLIPASDERSPTRTRNLAASYTRTIGTSMLNETRFGWMSVDGGQASLNSGLDFAGRVGLLGVTRDPRDVGFPQIDTGGLYSAMGESDELRLPAERALRALRQLPDRPRRAPSEVRRVLVPPPLPARERRHRPRPLPLHRPVQRQPVRRLPARLSGAGALRRRRPRRRGRADQLVAPVRAGRLAAARRPHGERRAALRDQSAHARRRQPPVDDRRVGAGRPLRHRQRRRGQHLTRGTGVAAADPDPVGHVRPRSAGTAACCARAGRAFAPRLGFAWVPDDEGRTVVRGGYGIFLNQWAYSVQTAFTPQPAILLSEAGGRAGRQFVPSFDTRTILASDPTGSIGGSIMDYDFQVEYTQTWSGGFQTEVLRRRCSSSSTWGRTPSVPTTRPSTTCRCPDPGRSARAAPSRRSRASAPSGSTASPSTTR